MDTTTILLVALALIACTCSRSNRTKPAWSEHLKGWRKVFGLVAVLAVLFIVMNPEFLALGLLGDTAFFDMLVLALSLQMHEVVMRAFRSCVGVLSRGVRWLGIPSPGLRYVLAGLTVFVAGAVSAIQKAVHRILS